MRGIESTAGIDKLATAKAVNRIKLHQNRKKPSVLRVPPEQRNDLRELLRGCVWTKRGSLTARERNPLLVSVFVVRNLHSLEVPAVGNASSREASSKQP